MKKSKYMQVMLTVAIVLCAGSLFAVKGAAASPMTDVMTSAGYPVETAESILRTMNNAGFTEEQKLKTAAMLANHSDDTMLAVSFQQKIEEGVSKKVGPDGIVQALDKVKNRHDTADLFASELPVEKATDLKKTVIDCLAAGLTPEDALRVRALLRERERKMAREETEEMAIQTMLAAREMVRQGVRSRETASILENAIKNGEEPPAMHNLRERFRNRHEENVDELANRYRNALEKGYTISQVNQNGFSHSGTNAKSSGENSGGGNFGKENGGGGNGGNDAGGNGGEGGSGSGGNGAGGNAGGNGSGEAGGNGSGSGGNGGGANGGSGSGGNSDSNGGSSGSGGNSGSGGAGGNGSGGSGSGGGGNGSGGSR